MELAGLTAHEARTLLDGGEVTSVELTTAVLERISQVEDSVKAFVTVTDELAMRQAEQADVRIAAGDVQPLTGVPMVLKDNMITRGVRTTCSSRMLENFVPPYDATVTNRLYEQGAVLVGKGNLDEFAMGSSNENSAFHPTHNPWALDRVPGGSSGGPAAAVAADECMFALGSDTGGSIRQPASLCGIVGMKPTYGLVSRFGLVAFASSLDQIGPLTKDVRDCAITLNAIAGNDPNDSTSLSVDMPDYTQTLVEDLSGLRIGVPVEYFGEGLEAGVEGAVREAIDVMRSLGSRGGGDIAAEHAARTGGVLHHRAIGGVGEPGTVRRREVRLLRAGCGRRVGRAGEDAAIWLWARGEAAHNAGDLRIVGGVLRRVLRAGAAREDADPARVRAGVHAV